LVGDVGAVPLEGWILNIEVLALALVQARVSFKTTSIYFGAKPLENL